MKKTHALIILDGFGLAKAGAGNAVSLANTKTYDELIEKYPHTTLNASEEAVGLFPGQMGNSEVGHLNLGAGRIVKQISKQISDEVVSGNFFNNKILIKAFKTKGKVHLMGLLSNGGVHSSLEHLFSLLKLAKQQNKEEVFIHLFTDGRDSEPQSSLKFLKKLNLKIKQIGVGKIASVSGRYYAMDRDSNFNRIEKAYKALVFGESNNKFASAKLAIEASHKNKITDEFIEPSIIEENGTPIALIKNKDSIIFFNYRGDRARELSSSFVDNKFNEFKIKHFKELNFVAFTNYKSSLKKLKVAFKNQVLNNVLGQVLAKNNLTQLRVAESTKYAHVTYFFNGGVEKPYKNENRLLIPTKKVKTFDLLPEMSVNEIADAVIKEVTKDKYDFVLINFSNCDMVGHTGNIPATIKAVESVDKALTKVVEHFKSINASIMITADHGNAESMLTKDLKPQTSHSLNKVPFILVDDNYLKIKLKKNKELASVSATVLDVMGIKAPKEFDADSLIIK